jgi:hypothetical protein
MKALRILTLALALIATLHAKYVPTPEMAMSFAMNKDPKKWVPQFLDGDKTGIIYELVPEGQAIKAWKEMVAQQIAFTKNSLRKHVDDWKAMLLRADPMIEIKEEQRDDGSILVTYTSLAAQEMSMRRFIKAKDGIYMLAYHVRPSLKEEERVNIWLDILTASNLVPNPEKK